ncbi:MAG: helix-turn-helix domain-containing protein [bacterium]
MISRERILEAAARVYARHGFRGATTRLIAAEAGVNEVTLFRTFGSKGALLEAVLGPHSANVTPPELPAEPTDPEAELTTFVTTSLDNVRAMRPLLVHTMGEIEERPQAAEFACRGRRIFHDTITTYLRRLQSLGMANPDADVETAAVMLTGTVMSDAIARSFVPEVYPPMEDAPARYVRCFLQMMGVKKNAAPSVKKTSRTRIT